MDKELAGRKRIFSLAVVGFVILTVLAVVLWLVDARRNAKLDILVAPSMAVVKIDGSVYEDGEHRFEPGVVSVEISAEGFTMQVTEIELRAGETASLYTYLVPADGSMQWYAENPEEDLLLSAVGDAIAERDAAELASRYPISTVLPIVVVEVDPESYDWTEYRIDCGSFKGCKSEFCVKITDTTGGNKEKALTKIREAGFDPADYQVLYEHTPIEAL